VAGNGELLWPDDAAREAARWAAANGLGIWGGEVFAPRGPFTAMMVGEWRTEPEWRSSEPWADFVERALAQALEAIARTAGGEGGAASLIFLAYAPLGGFAEDAVRTRGVAGREGAVEFTTQEGASDG
jgi:hypothetical protein